VDEFRLVAAKNKKTKGKRKQAGVAETFYYWPYFNGSRLRITHLPSDFSWEVVDLGTVGWIAGVFSP
jgi:hypothetical protein